MILFNFQVCWLKSCSLVTVTGGGSIFMLYSLAIVFFVVRNFDPEHDDAVIAILTMLLILGVIEAVTAVIVFRISYSSNLPRQVKRNVFVNLLLKYYIYIITYFTQENVYFYIFVYLHLKFLA